jgi:predicted DNA-binding helix-hairpin-helix protein
LRYADLITLGASLRKAKHFIVAADYVPRGDASGARLRGVLARGMVSQQPDLFQGMACTAV